MSSVFIQYISVPLKNNHMLNLMLMILSLVIFIMPSSVNLRTTIYEPVTKKDIPQLGAKI